MPQTDSSKKVEKTPSSIVIKNVVATDKKGILLKPAVTTFLVNAKGLRKDFIKIAYTKRKDPPTGSIGTGISFDIPTSKDDIISIGKLTERIIKTASARGKKPSSIVIKNIVAEDKKGILIKPTEAIFVVNAKGFKKNFIKIAYTKDKNPPTGNVGTSISFDIPTSKDEIISIGKLTERIIKTASAKGKKPPTGNIGTKRLPEE